MPSQSSSYPSPNRDSYAVGWGSTYYGGPGSSQLRNVKLSVYDNSLCTYTMSTLNKDWKTQLCAGDLSGLKDTWNGDDGGPLFVSESINGKSKFVLAGITSYGYCASYG